MDYMSYIRAIRSSDLTSVQKITAIMIASHYDFSKGDPAFPTNKLLAKETGLGVSTLVKAKKVLSERGYLYSQMRWDNSCIYKPTLPGIIDSSPREKLNTHINTHINTQLNTNINTNININDSKESLVLNQIDIKTEDVFTFASETNEVAPVEIKANAAARIIEEDWLSW